MNGNREIRQWAHQGGAKEAPSNTLYAMRLALRNGANALELDVHRARGKALVVIHDSTLGRTTNGRGRVKRRNLDHLKSLNAAWWWVPGKVDDHHAPPEAYELREQGEHDPDLRIPTLDELLDEFRSVPMTIEVKAFRAAKPVVDTVRRAGRTGDVCLTAFNDLSVWRMRMAGRDLELAPGLLGTIWFFVRSRFGFRSGTYRYARLQVPDKKFGRQFVDKKLVDAAHGIGAPVDVWTIDEEDTMRRLLDVGVDGIMSDLPTVLARVVAERAA